MTKRLLFALLVGLAFAGCRSDDSATEDGAGSGGTGAVSSGGTGAAGFGGTGAAGFGGTGAAGFGGTGAAGYGGAGAGGTCPGGSGGTGGGTVGSTGACSVFGPSLISAKADGQLGLLQLADVDCDGKLDAVSPIWIAGGGSGGAGGGSGATGGGSGAAPGAPPNGALLVRRAKGDGTFEPATSLSLGMGPVGMVAGDFDGDSVTDIVVAGSPSYGVGRLSLVRGDCVKGLQAPVVIADPSPYAGMSFTSGDVNEDGIADVVVSRWDPPYAIEVLFGGAPPLKKKLTSPTLVDQPAVLAVADVDGDGHQDVAVAGHIGDEASSMQLLLNDGKGNLNKAAYLPVGGGLVRMTALDLDGDGADELVTDRAYSSQCDNKAFVDAFHFDAKSGQLTAQNLADAPEPAILEVGDVDADGHLDLAIGWAGSTTPHTEILFGGSSSPAVTDVPFAVGPMFRLGDVTGDGRIDLVGLVLGASYPSGNTALEVFPSKNLECQHKATSCGGPSAFGEVAVPLTLPAQRLVFGDVTGDGATDVVAIGKDALGLLTNDGKGNLQAGPQAAVAGIVDVSVGRVGPSGAPVVVIANGAPGWTTLDANGSVQKVSPKGFGDTLAIAAGDMDGDGKDDLVVSTFIGLAKTLVLPHADPTSAFEWSSPPYDQTYLRRALDVDDDGDTDLLVFQTGGQSSRYCLVRAPIKPTTPCEPLNGSYWSQLDIGDFDGDHQADFLSSSAAGGVSLETAAGSTTALLTLNEGWFSARVMQRKPAPALLLGMKGGELRVYAGAGGGKLLPGPPLFSHQADRLLRYVDAEDLDGDGRDELVGIAWDPAPTLWVLRECP